MNRTPMQSPVVLLGLVGAVSLAILVGTRLVSKTPEVGPMAPVFANPAERLEEIRIGRGQTFGGVLQSASVDWTDQNDLLLAFREQVNPRRIREDTRITLRWLRDPEQLRGVDVALSSDSTLCLNRDEVGWSSSLVHTPIQVDTLYASGVVQSSLWNSVIDDSELAQLNSPDRAMVIHWMDQIFQWQIEFSRQVREGDTYRFALEAEVRPDGTLRDGHIIAAEFVNGGTSYLAVWFDPNNDGSGTYYDETGKSVRRAFLMKPLEFRRISSVFSNSRLHPIHNIRRPHRGVDYAAASGTPIMATGDGVVIKASWGGELGNLVEIRHPNGWVTRYGHLSAFGPGIQQGTRVRQSQMIGRVGMTGGATGPHLHYEMRRSNGEALNPLQVRLPAGDPVPTNSWARWALDSRNRLEMLEALEGPPIAFLAEVPDSDSTSDGLDGGGN